MNRPAVVAATLLAAGALGVAWTQPGLARAMHEIKQRDDVYVLPPPPQLHVATLGYDAAAVDQLWAKLLVEYGTHLFERREFLDVPRYVDAILELEPTYPAIYKYVDTLLCYRPIRGTEEDARRARAYLERGTRERPRDWRVWMELGEFLAFIGPSFLSDDAEKDRWRHDGAVAMARSVELGGSADRSLSAATLLNKAGERDAAIRSLQRAYALADDEQTRQELAAKLERLQATAEREAAERDMRFLESRWRRDYPFTSRGIFLVLEPAPDPLRCVGPDAVGCANPACCREWEPLLPSAKR